MIPKENKETDVYLPHLLRDQTFWIKNQQNYSCSLKESQVNDGQLIKMLEKSN